MPGEGGLLMNTWPYGGENALELGYDHIKWGRLRVQTLAFDLPAGTTATRVAVTVDSRATAKEVTQEGDRVTVALHQPLTAQAGEKIEIRVRYE